MGIGVIQKIALQSPGFAVDLLPFGRGSILISISSSLIAPSPGLGGASVAIKNQFFGPMR